MFKSDIGGIVEHVRELHAARPREQFRFLQGWQVVADMPSLEDMARVYERLAALIRNEESFFLSDVAVQMNDFRGTRSFYDTEREYCGLLFSRDCGSFLFAFGLEDARTVQMYCMGIAYPSPELRDAAVMRHCSRMASDLEERLEVAYLDLRDRVIGKHGITLEAAQ